MVVFHTILLGFILNHAQLLDASNATFPYISNIPQVTHATTPLSFNVQTVSPTNRYPFYVTLYIYRGDTYVCGGSLLSADWVLTAAHCVDGHPSKIVVILGVHHLSDPFESSRQTFNYEKMFIHPKWDRLTFQYDIALIKLPNSTNLNKNVGTIEIAKADYAYADKMGTILGFGFTEIHKTSDELLEVTVPIITTDACRAATHTYKKFKAIQETQVCTSGVGVKGGCYGDPGGPLIISDVVLGVGSWKNSECAQELPTVFTRVPSFSDWVELIMSTKNYNKSGSIRIVSESWAIIINMSLLVLLFLK